MVSGLPNRHRKTYLYSFYLGMLSKNSAVCLKRRRIINYQSCLDSSLSSSIPTASFNTLKKSWFNKKNWRSRVANRICCQLNTIRNWMILQLGNKTTTTKSILFFCSFSWFNYFFFHCTESSAMNWRYLLHFTFSYIISKYSVDSRCTRFLPMCTYGDCYFRASPLRRHTYNGLFLRI